MILKQSPFRGLNAPQQGVRKGRISFFDDLVIKFRLLWSGALTRRVNKGRVYL